MPSSSEFHIFRDSRRRTSTSELVGAMRGHLRGWNSADSLSTLLLLAGELECALADAAPPPELRERASCLTDLFARAAIAGDSRQAVNLRDVVEAASSMLDGIHFSGDVSISVPEGFAYYALHPLDYADLVARCGIDASRAMVIGVRSIGTTLSAVVAAKLRQAGRPGARPDLPEGFRDFRDMGAYRSSHEASSVRRMTVRPNGHPYDRRCAFDQSQRVAITSASQRGALFLVCDEGPGRSGSSLLSVAEALEREGVPSSRVLILCAYEPDVATLCARDAAERWRRYRVASAGMTRRLPADAGEYLGSGEWRKNFSSARECWPAVWPQMERLCYGSADLRTVLTFEGHGPYGAAAAQRNRALSDAGFGLPYLGHEAGFGRHGLVKGRVAHREDVSAQLLTHMAEYCAWRAREFAVARTDAAQLEIMTRVNCEREFGTAVDDLFLPVERPAICDSRMMPHEWLQAENGRWLKLDAAIHGDDHFFPGPCDIAWDLAGVIVEWNLSLAARNFFLAEYRNAGADDPTTRIGVYQVAYATFRMAWSAMAAASVRGTEEEPALLRDYERYRRLLRTEVGGSAVRRSAKKLLGLERKLNRKERETTCCKTPP